jgi:hypothetical protein
MVVGWTVVGGSVGVVVPEEQFARGDGGFALEDLINELPLLPLE